MPRGNTAARSRRKYTRDRPRNKNKKEMEEDEYSEKKIETESASEASAKEEQQQQEEYVVENIVDHRNNDDGDREYFVKWKDWASSTNTWEPAHHLSHCQTLVQQYEDSLKNEDEKVNEESVKHKMRKKSESVMSIDDDEEDDDLDEESQNLSPQITTKRQKRKSTANRVTITFSDDEDEEDKNAPSESVDPVDKNTNTKDGNTKYVDNESDADENEADDEEEEEEEEEHYTVEAIRKHRKSKKSRYPKYTEDGERCYEYLVKWEGWKESTNTWEHETELAQCRKLIDGYWNDKKKEDEEKQKAKNKKKNARKIRKKPKKNEEEKTKQTETKREEKKPKQVEKKTKKLPKNFKAKRVAIFAPEDEENEGDNLNNAKSEEHEANVDITKKGEVEKQITEPLDIEDIDFDDNVNDDDDEAQTVDKKRKKSSRKRALCDDDDDECEDMNDIEPPLKKRRIDETREWIKKGGIDMFLKVFDKGADHEKLKETLMDLVEKIHQE